MKRAFTLIEIVIFIVVFSVGVVGILVLFYNTLGKIYDPTLRLKGVQVAQAVMEEIYGKYWDNDTYFSDNGTIPLNLANIGREESSDNINTFDDIDDFVKCSSWSTCPCATTSYDSGDFGVTPGYKVEIKISYATMDNNSIVEKCDSPTELKLITVSVSYEKYNKDEKYTLKYIKGNF